jgi:AsmA-like C-terminal region
MRFDSSFWRKCRVGFRWCRITVLSVVLLLVCAFSWLNHVGLPDFLKERLVGALHTQGVDLEFTRLRLRVIRGLVADNVRVGHAQLPGNPKLSLAEVQLRLNFHALLLHRQWQIDGLILRQGKFVWPVSPTNALTLDHIQSDLRFQTNGTWTLDNFQADFAGTKILLAGEITHAPELRDWKMFQPKKNGGQPTLLIHLQKISEALDRIHFDGTPKLNLTLNGDARDFHSLIVRLNVTVPAAQTPWGGVSRATLIAQASPQRLDCLPQTTVYLEAGEARTRWGDARDLHLTANLTVPDDVTTNFDSSWDFWTNAQPYRLVWTAQLKNLNSEKLEADSVACSGFWLAPELAVTSLFAELGGGRLDTEARLNVATRELTFTNSSRFDLHAIAAFLTKKTQARLADFSWAQPPLIHSGGSLILPAWTNRQPDLRTEVQPTILLAGELAFTNGAVMGAAIDSAHAHFSYSNLVWQVPDLAVAQAKTKLDLSGDEDDATKNYRWHVHGLLDPNAARPFLTTSNAIRGFKIATFAEPVALDLNVSGRLYDYERLAANGHLAVTNFSVRGETFGDVTAALNYTNRVLEFLNPLMHNGGQMLKADKLTLDFNRRLILFTNGFSTADPAPLTRAIGPKTARMVAPYHFLQPPTARVNGQIPLHDMNGGRDMADVDMQFDIIKGAPFEWLKLKTTNILGTIHWLGQSLILTNVTAAIYGGTGNGFANFDFRPAHPGADYQFMVEVTNVNVHLAAMNLASASNHLEGALAGKLTVTHADSRDWQTWDGHGHAQLHDGLIWDVPIFGILSPVLNTISPGLGSSRARDASVRFIITNGVIFTDSLEIHSTLARLKYSGTLDLKQNVNARVEAQLLRNTPVIGSLISTVLWPVSKLFEYQVTGTLKNAKVAPVHGLLLMPLHPIRSLENMFPSDDMFTNPSPEK